MNKTVNINISGMVFHIEEDAYDVLKKYMHEIKTWFSQSADEVEIVTDIENRIAEMFTEILGKENREVIVLKDVEGVIGQIGRVSDFQEAEAGEEVPPVQEVPRRLFRDPDDKKLGGVCAGISHYFDWDPVWLRIVWALLAIFYGVGIIIYIILWLVIPEAKTLSEKMAMKGEKFHLSHFKRSFSEEMDGVKDTLHSIKEEAGNLGSRGGNSFKNFVNEVIDLIARVLRGLGKILIPITAIVLIVLGVTWLIGTFTGMGFFYGFKDISSADHMPFNLIAPEYRDGLMISLAGLIGIPALALLLLGLRILLNKKFISSSVGWVMLGLWLVSLGFTIYFGTETASDFRDEASVSRTTKLQPVPGNTYYLKGAGGIRDGKEWLSIRDGDDHVSIHSGSVDIQDGDDHVRIRPGSVDIRSGKDGFRYRYRRGSWDPDLYEADLNIVPGPAGQAALTEVFYSRGRNFENAAKNAEDIRYEHAQTDSLITLNRYFSLSGQSLWRAQEVDLTLQLPLNSTLVLDEQVKHFLDRDGLYEYDYWEIKKWTLTEDGLVPAGDTTRHER